LQAQRSVAKLAHWQACVVGVWRPRMALVRMEWAALEGSSLALARASCEGARSAKAAVAQLCGVYVREREDALSTFQAELTAAKESHRREAGALQAQIAALEARADRMAADHAEKARAAAERERAQSDKIGRLESQVQTLEETVARQLKDVSRKTKEALKAKEEADRSEALRKQVAQSLERSLAKEAALAQQLRAANESAALIRHEAEEADKARGRHSRPTGGPMPQTWEGVPFGEAPIRDA
jgi:hypothetical protein